MNKLTSMNRRDYDAFCPRQNCTVPIIGETCYSENRTKTCSGCLMDQNYVTARLLVLLSGILTKKARAAATDISEIGTVKFSTVNESNPMIYPKTGGEK